MQNNIYINVKSRTDNSISLLYALLPFVNERKRIGLYSSNIMNTLWVSDGLGLSRDSYIVLSGSDELTEFYDCDVIVFLDVFYCISSCGQKILDFCKNSKHKTIFIETSFDHSLER